MFGIKADWSLEVYERYFTLDDYGSGSDVRWCSGCGAFAILNKVHRVLRDAQVPPEKSVAVSGIGCSSRMPHYMGTYGFHGLHGRALPVANGIKSRRTDLDVWVATGDGDCFSIGAGPWLHALHLNMDMVILVFDNGIYGLTKKQTSPTTKKGTKTNTHPHGALLPPLNPLTITLGITNVSFVAQVVDWNPPLLYETIKAAHQHRGTSFVRVLQRCPVFSEEFTRPMQENPDKFTLLEHEDGITIDDNVKRLFSQVVEHDPADWLGAMKYAKDEESMPLGILFKDPDAIVYEDLSSQGVGMTNEEKVAGLNAAFDKFSI